MEGAKMFIIRIIMSDSSGDSPIKVRNLIIVNGDGIEDITAKHVLKKYLSPFHADAGILPVRYDAENKFAAYTDIYADVYLESRTECEEVTNIVSYNTIEGGFL